MTVEVEDTGYDTSPIVAPDGAFTMGGGAVVEFGGIAAPVSNYGQTGSEDAIKALFQLPAYGIGNAIDVLGHALSQLPLEALKLIGQLVPDWLEEDILDIGTAVSKILGALNPHNIPLTLAGFTQWLTDTFNTVSTELRQIMEIIGGIIVTPINAAVQAVKDWWNHLTGQTQHLNSTGGYDAGQLIGQVAKGAVEGLTELGDNVAGAFKGIFDAWFGGSHGTGTPAEVRQTVEAIKVAIEGGYVLQTFTANTPAWTLPAGIVLTDVTGVVINAGGCSMKGNWTTSSNSEQPGGTAGKGGAYIAKKLNLTGLTPGVSTLNIQVGAAGSTEGAVGGTSRIYSGATVLVDGGAGIGGIASLEGWALTSSTAGDGGNGGTGKFVTGTGGGSTAEPGAAGKSSAIAAGGSGGIGRTSASPGGVRGGDGTSGSAGTTNAVPLCGGGGGGGGGAGASTSTLTQVNGGDGGNGGYPGGGAGGGGAATGPNMGTTGNYALGAHGFCALIYKEA